MKEKQTIDNFLKDSEKKNIKAFVQKAEAKTSGEIKILVVQKIVNGKILKVYYKPTLVNGKYTYVKIEKDGISKEIKKSKKIQQQRARSYTRLQELKKSMSK